MSGAVKCVEFSPGLCKYLASTVFRELQRYIELFDYISLLDPLFFPHWTELWHDAVTNRKSVYHTVHRAST